MCLSSSLEVSEVFSPQDMMENHQEQIQDIITKLNIISRDLEHLIKISEKENKDNAKSITKDNEVSSENKKEEIKKELKFERHKALNSPVILNVDGAVFHSSWKHLKRLPDSRLGKIAESCSISDVLELCDNYNEENNEFYFHKKNKNFGEILEFYRTGSLHISDDNCVIAFERELQYWQISSDYLETCCLKRFADAKEIIDSDKILSPHPYIQEDLFPPGWRGRIQKYLWDLFENPHTSIAARAVAIISVCAIILATIVLTLNTLPYFQEKEDKIGGDYAVFAIMEAVYISWFTLEFVIRLVCCPQKKHFVKQFMNWIDFLAIVPYFISISIYFIVHDEDNTKQDDGTQNVLRSAQIFQIFRLLRIVKTLRIIRIFKLARHSTGLQALGYTVRSNYKELGLMILFLTMGAIMFSSLTYVFESENEASTIETMLEAYWWAIITMTTVGLLKYSKGWCKKNKSTQNLM